MAANLSDIAAMGGEPKWKAVCLALPEATSVEHVENLCRGMDAVSSRFGCTIVGGDTSLPPDRTAISITVIGGVEKERLTPRRGAKIVDAVCVTGDPGAQRLALNCLKRKGQPRRMWSGGIWSLSQGSGSQGRWPRWPESMR
ncbi:MAG: hypothetical protein DRQ02_06155 [Candidatus Latescibacterota bacterium]|nr:MAG: hypothetical protein DRQ02_06155 [Candidatus Latescibacterota bacterium]RKY71390.1 MAG: hypothetical protein DRQ24_07490 [Candidatus Latescibacterota bacterium]